MPTLKKLDITSNKKWVDGRVVHFLGRNALQSIVSSLFVVLLVSWTNRAELIHSYPQIAWCLFGLLLGALRLLHYRQLNQVPEHLSYLQWLYSYRGLTLCSGAVYGVMPFLFFNDGSIVMQSLIIFIIIGMPAAAAGTHVIDNWTFRLFSLSIVVPATFFFMLNESDNYSALGFLMVLFWWVVDRSADRTRGSLLENIELTYNMSYRATHDSLVGLMNREELEHQFEKQAQHAKHGVAMLFLDLDNFKPLNDTLGHQAGDDALVRVAHIIRQSVRSDDLAARLGGDEFVIVQFLSSEADVTRLAKSLLQQVSSLSFDGGYGGLSVSIGISYHTTTQVGFSRLMRTADLALYDSKKAGKNQINLRHYSDDTTA